MEISVVPQNARPARKKPQVAVIVVHHGNWPTVKHTIDDLIAQTLPVAINVIDNTGDGGEAAQRIVEAYPAASVLHLGINRGYGAAINAAVNCMVDDSAEFVLVVTHEVRMDPELVANLVRTMTANDDLAAVGPALRRLCDDSVWSTGGGFSRVGIPTQKVAATHGLDREVGWIDGACVLYRREVLKANRFDERFFLYMEEVELHDRLRRAGHSIAVDGDLWARQDTRGVPWYLFARNIRLLNRLRGCRRNSPVALGVVFVQLISGLLTGEVSKASLRRFVRGAATRNYGVPADDWREHNPLPSLPSPADDTSEPEEAVSVL